MTGRDETVERIRQGFAQPVISPNGTQIRYAGAEAWSESPHTARAIRFQESLGLMKLWAQPEYAVEDDVYPAGAWVWIDKDNCPHVTAVPIQNIKPPSDDTNRRMNLLLLEISVTVRKKLAGIFLEREIFYEEIPVAAHPVDQWLTELLKMTFDGDQSSAMPPDLSFEFLETANPPLVQHFAATRNHILDLDLEEILRAAEGPEHRSVLHMPYHEEINVPLSAPEHIC